jgi:hypothetical protein
LGSVYSVYHPQTNFKVVGVPGLAGSNVIALGPQQYFLAGVDLTDDSDSFRAWWSQDLTIKKLQLGGLVKSEELLETL